MSWTDFLILVFIIYLLYYALNLVFDLFFSPKTAVEVDHEEIFLSDTFSPELIIPEDVGAAVSAIAENQKSVPAPALVSKGLSFTGGVGLKTLFNLAKDNLIEHTRAIPY